MSTTDPIDHLRQLRHQLRNELSAVRLSAGAAVMMLRKGDTATALEMLAVLDQSVAQIVDVAVRELDQNARGKVTQ